MSGSSDYPHRFIYQGTLLYFIKPTNGLIIPLIIIKLFSSSIIYITLFHQNHQSSTNQQPTTP